jgi:hypothetical protein
MRPQGLLLVIYGTLGSDYGLWETTNMVNGYFLAVCPSMISNPCLISDK